MTVLGVGIPDYDDIVEIGRGAFSILYQGRQRAFGRPVAIKVLATPRGPESHRFERECEAIGRLSGHPGIVTVYDAGTDLEGRCYLVMELLTGGSLADLLAEVQCLDVAQVLTIGVTLAGALESAHRAGVTHGDVKPDNVLLSGYGHPKLADFGLATLWGKEHASPGFTGTLAYVAPEVLAGRPVMPQADVYGLACTLHTLLAGRPPFVDAGEVNLPSVAARTAADPPEDLRGRDIPGPLCRVLQDGMAKDPSLRPTSAQLGRQLQAVQARLGHPITPLLLEGDDPPVAHGAAPVKPLRRVPMTTWWRLGGVILLVVGLIGLSTTKPEPTSVKLPGQCTDRVRSRRREGLVRAGRSDRNRRLRRRAVPNGRQAAGVAVHVGHGISGCGLVARLSRSSPT